MKICNNVQAAARVLLAHCFVRRNVAAAALQSAWRHHAAMAHARCFINGPALFLVTLVNTGLRVEGLQQWLR